MTSGGRNGEAIAMVNSLTSVVVMTALATIAAASAPAQPIDLLGPPTVRAPPDDTAVFDTRAPTMPAVPGAPSHSREEPVVTLEAARRALAAGQIREAQKAIERAQTQLLNGSAAAVQANSS